MRSARFECACGASVVTDFRDVDVIDREGNAIPRTWDALCETIRKHGWWRDARTTPEWRCPDCAKERP